MIIKHVATAAAAGVAAVFAVAAPAAAATTPTLDQPTIRTGFGIITLTGTADPGSTVYLWEAALKFRTDMYQAPDYDRGGFVSSIAGSNGRFEIRRNQDSGFRWYVESGGLRSNHIDVSIRAGVTLSLSSPGSGQVSATVGVSPSQPFLPVQVQRLSGGSWTTVASGHTSDPAATFSASDSGLFGGSHTYRAHIGADADNGIVANYSDSVAITVQGPTNPNPTPTTPKPTPTTPTPKPTTPKPTPPKPATPAVGSVQFTRIQYNAPGTDKTTTKSLNGEWFRVTNKTKKAISLKGWTVRDAANHVYTFGTFTLGAGKSITVRTGKGTNTSTYRYWGRKGHVWNNGGDTAILRTNAKKTIDTCRWGKGSGVTSC
ncbi:lamin tail domain-containing protein [Paractinoplanes rishiriensis]|uniref:LTD domain-containing protein n=1 Tax=Paractinoplanes rishiriensis TaxID=1050105 RepID=A0A919JVS9_9ACTN|nr:lamin tail domain-containing protein [Actinoplanes rishiriensis]GIE94053.1 hypothetical protein Ari01nite_15180 [Actinoplanes rishiriensis]